MISKLRLIFALLILFPITKLHAENVCLHGHAAHMEYPKNSSENVYKGWGYDSTKSGLYQWLHYAIPVSQSKSKVSSITVRFFLGSIDNFVKAVHLYNGKSKIHSANNLNWSNSGWNTKVIRLTRPLDVRNGLGISIRTGSGVESMSHRIIISRVCANLNE